MKRSSFAAALVLAAVGALAGPQTRPVNAAAARPGSPQATRPGSPQATRPGSPQAPRPAKQAGKRAKLLKANLDSFALRLSYLAVKKEQSAAASLSTWKGPGPAPKGLRGGVWISKAQAAAIIDHLDRSGVLSRLLDPQTEAIIDMQMPMPNLHVHVTAGQLRFQNWLPIDPKAVELLEALGKLLDGDAGKAMDKLLKALEPQRKIWRRQKAALFVKRLKASKRTLNLVLTYHPVGLKDLNTYPNLHLLWMEPAGVNLPSSMIVMSKREAMAAIDALARSGYFERAGDITARRAMRTATPWPQHKGPCYSLTVSNDNRDYHANLGWDLKMLKRLDALRKVLDKDSAAGKAMDKVIKALEPQRKKWEEAAGGGKGQSVATPWSAPTTEGLQTRMVCPVKVFGPGDYATPMRLELRHKSGKSWASNTIAHGYTGGFVVTDARGSAVVRESVKLKFNTAVDGVGVLATFSLAGRKAIIDRPGRYTVRFVGSVPSAVNRRRGLVALPATPSLALEIRATAAVPAAMPVRFKTVKEALAFLVACIDKNDPKRLSAACISERPRAQMYFNSLAALHAATPLPKLYAGKTFPKDKAGFKLGGHGKKWHHIHVDFARKEDGWALADIWVCR